MNFKKTLIGGILAVLGVAFLGNVATAASLNDPEFTDALAWMYENGMTKYDMEEDFMPMATLSREAFAKFSAAYAATNLCLEADDTMPCDFSDLDSADPTLQSAIVAACEMGLVKGSGGMFYPKNPISKAAVLTVLDRALSAAAGEEPASEDMTPRWKGHFDAMRDLGITKETDPYAVDRDVTRYEVALMLYRARVEDATCSDDTSLSDLLAELFGDEGDADDMTDDTTTDDTTDDAGAETMGDLSVVLSPTTPAGAVVPMGAALPVAAYDVTADANSELQSVRLRRTGLGNDPVRDVTVFVNGEAVTKTKGFNSDDEVLLTFNPVVSVNGSETVTLEVVATVDPAASSNEEFAINLVELNGVAVGPIVANTFEVAGVSAVMVQVDDDGSISDVELGNTEVEVAKFTIENQATNNADVTITQVTLKDTMKNADDDLRNFVLKHDGNVVATAPATNGKYLTLNFDTPVVIEDGNTEDFRLYADVVDGAGDVIAFVIDKSIYVIGTDSDYGYGLNVDVTPYTAQAFTINAGQVTLVEKHLDVDKIRAKKDNLVVADFDINVNAGQDLSLEDIRFDFVAPVGFLTNGTNDMSDLFDNVEMKITVNGSSNTYDLDMSNNTNTTVTYSDTDMGIILPDAGDVNVQLVVDTANTFDPADIGKTFKVTLNTGVGFEIIENSDDTVVTDIVPSSITFDSVELVESSLEASAIGLANVDVVVGAENVDAVMFTLDTDDVSPAEVDSFTFADAGAGNFDTAHVTAVKLWKETDSGWELLEEQGGFDINAGSITFDDFGVVVVPLASTQKFLLTVNIADDPTNVGDVVDVKLVDVQADDDDNDTLVVNNASTGNPVDAGANAIDSSRSILIQASGNLTGVIDNNDPEISNNDKYVLGGTTSEFVASFELTATDEAIEIEDATIVVGGPGAGGFSIAVSEIILYDSDKTTELYRKVVAGSTIQLNNLNYVVPEGSVNLYLKIVANTMGDGHNGAYIDDVNFTLNIATNDARGVDSGDDIAAPVSAGPSVNSSVVPVRIASLEFVDSAYGYTISTTASPGTSQDIAILKVTADTWSNTNASDGSALDLVLESLTFTYPASVTNLKLKRIDVTSAEFAEVAGSFDLSAQPESVKNIQSGQTAYYLVRGDLSAPVGSTVSVKVEMKNLDGGSALSFIDDGGNLVGSLTEARIGVDEVPGAVTIQVEG